MFRYLASRAFGMLERPTALFRPHVLAAALRARPVSAERAPVPVAGLPAPRTPAEHRQEARS